MIYIPINHKNSIHWSYLCFDCQTKPFGYLIQGVQWLRQIRLYFQAHPMYFGVFIQDRCPGDRPFFPWTVRFVNLPHQMDGNNFTLINAAVAMCVAKA